MLEVGDGADSLNVLVENLLFKIEKAGWRHFIEDVQQVTEFRSIKVILAMKWQIKIWMDEMEPGV